MRLSALLVLIAMVAAARGQSGMFTMPEYPAFLVRYSEVRKELGISPAIAAKMAKARAEAQKRLMKMIAPTPANPNVVGRPSAAEMQKNMNRVDSEQLALLSSKQKARLKEIGVQYAGGLGLADPGIGKKLGLSRDQHVRIRTLGLEAIKTYNDKASKVVSKGNGFRNRAGSPEVMRAIAQERIVMLRSLEKDVVKVLTAAQLSKWKRMQGKPFPLLPLFMPAKS